MRCEVRWMLCRHCEAAWTQSVPSAVADGYEVEALDLLMFS